MENRDKYKLANEAKGAAALAKEAAWGMPAQIVEAAQAQAIGQVVAAGVIADKTRST